MPLLCANKVAAVEPRYLCAACLADCRVLGCAPATYSTAWFHQAIMKRRLTVVATPPALPLEDDTHFAGYP